MLNRLTDRPDVDINRVITVFSVTNDFLLGVATLARNCQILSRFLTSRHQLRRLLSLTGFSRNQRRRVRPDRRSALILSPYIVSSSVAIHLSVRGSVALVRNRSITVAKPDKTNGSALLRTLTNLGTTLEDRLDVSNIPISGLDTRARLDIVECYPRLPRFLRNAFRRSILFKVRPSSRLGATVGHLGLRGVIDRHGLERGTAGVSNNRTGHLSLLHLVGEPKHFGLFSRPDTSVRPGVTTPM